MTDITQALRDLAEFTTAAPLLRAAADTIETLQDDRDAARVDAGIFVGERDAARAEVARLRKLVEELGSDCERNLALYKQRGKDAADAEDQVARLRDALTGIYEFNGGLALNAVDWTVEMKRIARVALGEVPVIEVPVHRCPSCGQEWIDTTVTGRFEGPDDFKAHLDALGEGT